MSTDESSPSIDFECMEVSGMHAVMERIHLGMEETCRSYLNAITLSDVISDLDEDQTK